MAKAKFHFNPSTLTYERVDNSIKYKLKRIALHFFTSILLGFLLFVAFIFAFNSPTERELIRENRMLLAQYNILNSRLDVMQEVLTDIQLRDNNMFRVIYQADPIDESVRRSPFGGPNRYRELMGFNNSALMINITEKVDILARQLYIQSLSFDELVVLAKTNESRLRHIPAIQPILNEDLTRISSGFGWRIDPFHRIRTFHSGIDFSAPVGSDVFATGNGVVTFAGWRQAYGNTIIINHGYNYETLYAHLHRIHVRRGQRVTRGEVIGEVGNTGRSTGPHLHYEVIYRGRPVNPINYFFMDLSPEEYDIMLRLASSFTQALD